MTSLGTSTSLGTLSTGASQADSGGQQPRGHRWRVWFTALHRVSLRSRLLVLLVALTATVLAAGGAATLQALRAFLFDRTDQQLGQLVDQTGRAVLRGDLETAHAGPPVTGVIRLLVSADGATAIALPDRFGSRVPSTTVTTAAAQRLAQLGPVGQPQTIDRLPGVSGRYRAETSVLPNGTMIVLGLPLAPVEATLQRLLLIEIAVGLAGLVAVAVAGSLLIRVALRPLTGITVTTRRIAGADLSRLDTAVRLRVPDLPGGSEVGQLGQGMNHMLNAIDNAFAERNEAERQLRQFVADASHELRTPLTTIRGYAELFDRAPTGDLGELQDVGTAMRRIEEESRRMGMLVDDLLLLARLDQGRPLEREAVDLSRIVADAANDFRVSDHQRPVRLDLPAEPVMVTGDEQRLRQVLANLLANVHAHTPATTIVTVRVHADDESGTVEVHDTGPGIPVEVAEHVFDRFYRGDPSRARSSGGSGLGLSIVRAIVRAHDGQITLRSEPGSTTLAAVLPAYPQPAA